MHIFLVRIPANTTKRDVVEFISPALKGGLFAPTGVLKNIQLVVLRNSRTNATEHYGIVQVEPDKAALRVIRQLNRKQLKGKPIHVRRYYIRNKKNDPRLKNQYPALNIKEKRLGERRCDTLEKQHRVKFEGDVQYAIKRREEKET